MSYNIGYFKHINPQLVDLMTIGDYIDDTVHNIWIFYVGVVLFFGSSFAFLNKKGRKTKEIIIIGAFSLFLSFYFFSKGEAYSKFWPMLKRMFSNEALLPFLVLLIIAVVLLCILITYLFVSKTASNRFSRYFLNYTPILIFIILGLSPYLGGMSRSYIETHHMHKDDYKIQLVDIRILEPDNMKLNDLFIVKSIDKGLVLRQFNKDSDNEEFIFINWANITQIIYKKAP